MENSPHILLATQKKPECELVAHAISVHFSRCQQTVLNEQSVIQELSANNYHILILDTDFPQMPPPQKLFSELAADFPHVLTIPLIPRDRPEYLEAAIDAGIFFYLQYPLEPLELKIVLKRVVTLHHHLRKDSDRQSIPSSQIRFPGFIGKCRVMEDLFDVIRKIASDDYSTVLIRGESGTGKELVAKAIHAISKRKNNNFVPVNCAAIPDDLLESELFGYAKGSFTGASQNKQGRIQYADGGTLFLDEIGDMKPTLQAKLLRVLQEKEFEPVGSLKTIPVDTRILAATHCDLEQFVKEGRFREDLYYRLSVIPIQIPPLRERIEDMPLLINEFVAKYTLKRGREKITFSPQSLSVLESYPWRGNIRELENLVQHMSILYSGKLIHPHDLPDKFTKNSTFTPNIIEQDFQGENDQNLDSSRERAELLSSPINFSPEIDFDNGPISFNEIIGDFEKELIIKAMNITSGNKKEAARMLNLKRTTLLEKIKKKELTSLWDK